MDKQSAERQGDHANQAGPLQGHQLPGSAHAASRAAATATAHAGSVLRRAPPPPGKPKTSWAVSRPLPSNVDIVDAARTQAHQQPENAHLSNVDTVDHSAKGGRKDMPPRPPRPAPVSTHNTNVDTVDKSLVSMSNTFGNGPKGVSIPPIPLPPKPGKSVDRRGPDESRFLAIVENRKQMLIDRAAAKGRNPNEGAVPSPVAKAKTRSRKTHEDYLRRGEGLMERYKKFANLTHLPVEAIDPVDFVNFCFSLKPTVKASAWRPYKQGIRTMLDTLPHERTSEAINLLDADINEDTGEVKKKPASTDPNERKLPRRTSAKKEKRFPKQHFDFVTTYLKVFARSKLSPILVDWMVAGVATGLRPIEWASTDFEVRDDPSMPNGRGVWLYVLNAKSTNGRALGLVRTLDLSHCSEETIGAVRRMSERGFEWLSDGEFDAMQRQISQVLYKACDSISALRGKTYALYSLRHQFVANAKSIYKTEEVAAMCGHGVEDTSVSNYGKKSSAWAPDEITERARPVDAEVAMVQPRISYFQQKIKLQQEAGLLKMAPSSDSDD